MTRRLIKLDNPVARLKAVTAINGAPEGYVMEIREPTRSNPQNDRLWASLTDIAAQKDWHGVHLDPADWKLIFMAALNREMRIVPNLDGNGFVNLGTSSSKLTKSEFGDLLDLIYDWGSRNGVVFSDTRAMGRVA